MRAFRRVAITPEAIARAIAFAIGQPDDVDVSEIVVRPTASPYQYWPEAARPVSNTASNAITAARPATGWARPAGAR